MATLTGNILIIPRLRRSGRARRHWARRSICIPSTGARGHLLQQCGAPSGPDVTKLLVLEKFAGVYERELGPRFPGLEIHKAATAADIAIDLAAIDVLFAFGIAINDGVMARATNLKWI